MKITISVIKADVGSVGGHMAPSRRLIEAVEKHISQRGAGLLIDHYISHTGDDVAILMTHTRGVGDEKVHKLAWDAFLAGTEEDAFSGNVRGMGPEVAEMEIDERPNEPFVFFAADKTDPGAFNLPLYLAFADVMYCPGLILSPKMAKGFRFVIMDVSHTEGDRVIELNSPEEIYDIAALLRDNERYVVESIWSRTTGEQAAAVATSRLHNIAGKYTGKDDPVMLVRTQMNFPATGEVLQPFAIGHFVAGCMRGSHQMPLMPVPLNSTVSYFDGPPVVSAAGFCVQQGKLTEPVDAFAHPFWNTVRDRISTKSMEMRLQGFSGAAMLPMNELEYTGVMEKLNALDTRFKVRSTEKKVAAD
jgi:fructose 1,6-bisphosphate aldolase/phosphatase